MLFHFWGDMGYGESCRLSAILSPMVAGGKEGYFIPFCFVGREVAKN